MWLHSPGIKLTALLAVLLSVLHKSEGAQILIFILQCSYSMLNVHHPYAVGLVEAGHDVTILLPTPFKTPHPKIKYIIPELANKRWKEFQSLGMDFFFLRQQMVEAGNSMTPGWEEVPPGGPVFCEAFLDSPGMKEWISGSKFDLVVVDSLYNDCGLGMALKSKAPFIYFETTALFPSSYDTYGLVPENSWLPDIRMMWSGEMSFLRRVRNVLGTLDMYFNHKRFNGYWARLEQIFEEKYGLESVPSLEELERNASLVLLNSHYSMEYARALPPNFILVGGIQCKEGDKKPLPENIAKFIGQFSGFIYVSFGTYAQLPPAKQEVFLETFRRIPKIGFIMKWIGERPKNVPSNALLLDFAPQQELLSHKKIQIFISHGGMLSTQEVSYYGVPVIGMPVIAEQDFNIESLRRHGAALKLEIITVTTEELVGAITEVLTNPSYDKAMKEIMRLSKDRPKHPLDEAVWWTGYVLRNAKDGTLAHMKPLGVHQYWFQRRCLDVWGFIFVLGLLALYIVLKLVMLVAKVFFGGSGNVPKKNKRA